MKRWQSVVNIAEDKKRSPVTYHSFENHAEITPVTFSPCGGASTPALFVHSLISCCASIRCVEPGYGLNVAH